ncbi:hypothetical protein VNI00_014726 [Paramarasmius palmivorus]|uniref:BAG domain-containing protein n=1 Tax=Paramarasmius palmivorus TaxID=297713 RepID=A0AAW0BRP7_9AGAR
MLPTLRYPYYGNQLYGHSSRINPRDRYLAALAEAKVAEAELLAEEEARREEEQLAEELALRKRLEEIQASRRRHTSHLDVYDDFSLHRRHSYNPHAPGYASEDRLTRLRREMEEDELRAARQKKLEREVILRKEAEIIAQKRKEEENRLELVRRRREQEEKRLLELRRAQTVQASVAPTCKRPYSSQTSHPVYITLEDLLGQFERPLTRSDTAIRPSQPTKATKTAISDVASPEDFLDLIFGVAGKPSHGTEQKQSATAPVPSVTKPATVPKATAKPKATDDLANFNPEDVVKLLFGLGSQFMGAAQQEPSSTPQASSSKAGPSGSRSSSSTSTTQPVQMQQAHACNNVAAPSPKRPEPSSLKDELEARLYNDCDTEIRDTMQAILASLADAATYEQASSAPAPAPAPSSASSSATSFTSKGKEKAEERQAKAEGEATSQDVVNAMDTVNTIEAAFVVLQQDFTFPSQLDFTPPSSRPSSPVSDTLSSKLAYTSRNHPLRYYEQSLSGLLSQLDSVESFGSAEVRQRRKEVVERVEGAIDELEKEVEGRWQSRVAKEEKEAKEITQAQPILVKDTELQTAAPAASRERMDHNHVERTSVVPSKVPAQAETATKEAIEDSDTVSHNIENSQAPALLEQPAQPSVEGVSELRSSSPLGDSHSHSSHVIDTSSTSSYPPAASSNSSPVDTIQPYDVGTDASTPSGIVQNGGSEDAFLLSQSTDDSTRIRLAKNEGDVGSDWSEVEA